MRKSSLISSFKLDEFNIKILEILQTRARITFPNLAEQIGLSTSPCFIRVRKLQSTHVIKGYLADINLAALGPHVMVLTTVALHKHDQHQERRFCQIVSQMPEIVWAYQVSGPHDYQLLCVCRDISQYQEIAKQLLSDEVGVSKLESHVVLKTVKDFGGYPLRQIAEFNGPP